jgi:solute:Na+ symporter, SSS family
MADFRLHWIDQAIVLAHLVLTFGAGFWISKRATKSIRSYFLVGKKVWKNPPPNWRVRV